MCSAHSLNLRHTTILRACMRALAPSRKRAEESTRTVREGDDGSEPRPPLSSGDVLGLYSLATPSYEALRASPLVEARSLAGVS